MWFCWVFVKLLPAVHSREHMNESSNTDPFTGLFPHFSYSHLACLCHCFRLAGERSAHGGGERKEETWMGEFWVLQARATASLISSFFSFWVRGRRWERITILGKGKKTYCPIGNPALCREERQKIPHPPRREIWRVCEEWDGKWLDMWMKWCFSVWGELTALEREKLNDWGHRGGSTFYFLQLENHMLEEKPMFPAALCHCLL